MEASSILCLGFMAVEGIHAAPIFLMPKVSKSHGQTSPEASLTKITTDGMPVKKNQQQPLRLSSHKQRATAHMKGALTMHRAICSTERQQANSLMVMVSCNI